MHSVHVLYTRHREVHLLMRGVINTPHETSQNSKARRMTVSFNRGLKEIVKGNAPIYTKIEALLNTSLTPYKLCSLVVILDASSTARKGAEVLVVDCASSKFSVK